jgi:hypothetical protein
LLAETAGQAHHGPKCWGSKLTGQTKAFVDAARQRARNGEYVNQATVGRLLKTEFGLAIVTSSVRGHLLGICGCK